MEAWRVPVSSTAAVCASVVCWAQRRRICPRELPRIPQPCESHGRVAPPATQKRRGGLIRSPSRPSSTRPGVSREHGFLGLGTGRWRDRGGLLDRTLRVSSEPKHLQLRGGPELQRMLAAPSQSPARRRSPDTATFSSPGKPRFEAPGSGSCTLVSLGLAQPASKAKRPNAPKAKGMLDQGIRAKPPDGAIRRRHPHRGRRGPLLLLLLLPLSSPGRGPVWGIVRGQWGMVPYFRGLGWSRWTCMEEPRSGPARNGFLPSTIVWGQARFCRRRRFS